MKLVNEELPLVLPPMGSEQHSIDLVPRDSSANMPVYRMPSLQQAEMHKQVKRVSYQEFGTGDENNSQGPRWYECW